MQRLHETQLMFCNKFWCNFIDYIPSLRCFDELGPVLFWHDMEVLSLFIERGLLCNCFMRLQMHLHVLSLWDTVSFVTETLFAFKKPQQRARHLQTVNISLSFSEISANCELKWSKLVPGLAAVTALPCFNTSCKCFVSGWGFQSCENYQVTHTKLGNLCHRRLIVSVKKKHPQ